jgi:hypothetical protein
MLQAQNLPFLLESLTVPGICKARRRDDNELLDIVSDVLNLDHIN